jgi:hypothetical protein
MSGGRSTDTMPDFTAVGDAISVTARLSAAAASGEVLISDEACAASGSQGTLSLAGRCLAEEDRRFGAAGLQGHPPQDAFVDVVEGDPEREGPLVPQGGFALLVICEIASVFYRRPG